MADRDTGMVDVTVAFALGALFGAGLAILLAPDKGEKTRKRLSKRSKKWRKEAGKRLDDARETGEDWLEDAEGTLAGVSEEIADAVQQGVKTIRETVSDEVDRIEKQLGKKKRGLFG
ncbi:MAG TPA: YtxH domain-containing protein [Gemmatimonadota bacterium]|nr:YtxH domain-containing protein [Gemmatimonadota bacterium]